MARLGRPVRACFADVTTATARVQAPEECGVVAQAGQGCCGTLMLPVGLEFVIRPPLEAGPCPGSGRSNAHG